MARPVNISITADARDAARGFDQAAGAAKDAGRDFDQVADKAGDVASTSSQVAGGLGDLGGALSQLPGPLGSVGSGMELLAPSIMGVTGAADLFEAALGKIPGGAKVASAASRGFAAAQRAVGIAVRFAMGPVGLIIAGLALLVGGLILAYKRSETFRAIVDAAFAVVKRAASAVVTFFTEKVPAAFGKIMDAGRSVLGWARRNWPLLLAILTGPFGLAVLAIVKNWDKIKSGATGVKTWVTNKFDDLVGFFTRLPSRVTRAVSGMWSGLTGGFRSALNSIIRWWNNFSLTLDIPDAIPGLPDSFTINTPNVPYLASGGIVTRPTLAVIGEAGPEAVVPLNGRYAMGSTTVIKVTVSVPPTANPAAVGKEIQKVLDAYRREGGRVAA